MTSPLAIYCGSNSIPVSLFRYQKRLRFLGARLSDHMCLATLNLHQHGVKAITLSFLGELESSVRRFIVCPVQGITDFFRLVGTGALDRLHQDVHGVVARSIVLARELLVLFLVTINKPGIALALHIGHIRY